MLGQEHLTLRLVRLRTPEEWSHNGGLTFLFPKGGTGHYACGHLTQQLAPGDVAVVSGEPAGRLSVAEGEELVFWAFSLCLEHLLPLFATDEIALLQTVVDDLKGVRFHPATGRLAAECHRLIAELPPQFNLDHRSQLLRVAAAILTEEFKTARHERVGYIRAEEHLVQAFEKLSTEQLLRLSVDELARKFGCSRRHLNRLFHRHFGFSIVGLRMELRLLKAVSLLRDPSAKVIRVAEQAGFNHLGLFNSCFRKRFGTSPGHWRKLAAQAQAGGAEPGEAGARCPMHPDGLCPKWCEANPAQAGSDPAENGTRRPACFPALSTPDWCTGSSHAASTRKVARPNNSNPGDPAEGEAPFSTSSQTKSPVTALLERCARL